MTVSVRKWFVFAMAACLVFWAIIALVGFLVSTHLSNSLAQNHRFCMILGEDWPEMESCGGTITFENHKKLVCMHLWCNLKIGDAVTFELYGPDDAGTAFDGRTSVQLSKTEEFFGPFPGWVDTCISAADSVFDGIQDCPPLYFVNMNISKQSSYRDSLHSNCRL